MGTATPAPRTPEGTSALARRLGLRLADTAAARVAFLAGSVVEGLGNATSDVDVYLAGPGWAPERRQLAVDTVRVDVHRLPDDALAAATERVLSTRPLSDGSVPPVAERDLVLVTRLATAELLVGEEAVSTVRHRLREGRSRLRRQVLFAWLTDAHAQHEDFTGLVLEGAMDPALTVGRGTLIAAGKAVAAAGDDLYLGRKWAWHQLERSAPARFPRQVFTHLLRADLLGGAPGSSLDDLGNFTQTCLAAVSTLGWQHVTLEAWPTWLRGNGPLSRAPGFHPRAFDDGVVLTRPGARRVRLSPEAALVWALCNGSSADAVVALAGELARTAAVYAGCTEERCRGIIASLEEAELVVGS
ncbi:hypothetical protein [Streptomyces radicis]|uniref:hypothetical protein n=1 Tax=Streptomyces radicis TaxID=1750517 RepID=UPI0011C45A1A|nr:hypothetical protein [Streptomyces radicis]